MSKVSAAAPPHSPPSRFLMQSEKRHKPCSVCIIFFSFLIFIANAIVNTIAQRGILNSKTISDVSSNSDLIITPISSTFLIWIFIYALLFLLHLYSVINICRSDVEYLYQVNGLVTNTTLILLSISYILCSSWIFAFLYHDKIPNIQYQMIPAAICLCVLTLVNFIALCTAQTSNSYGCLTNDISRASKKENAIYQLLVVNPIGLFFGWTMIASVLSIGIAIKGYMQDNYNSEDVADYLMILLTALVSFYAFIDIARSRITAYTVMPYVSFLVGLVGIYLKKNNSNFPLRNSIKILMTFVIVFLSSKLMLCTLSSMKYFKRKKY